jgi:hypothetical protein
LDVEDHGKRRLYRRWRAGDAASTARAGGESVTIEAAMKLPLAVFAFLAGATLAGAATDFTLEAAYEPPAKGKTEGSVAVTFSPINPDVKINEEPSPHLTLDAAQTLLDDRQPPAKVGAVADPEKIKAIDLSKPVRFAVAPRAGAPSGTHKVEATVLYFYCSKREGWCRKGKTPVEFSVTIP